MVIWIDEQLKKEGKHREQKNVVKSLYFKDKTTFDKMPLYQDFTLVIAKYDAFSPVIMGYTRYKNCGVLTKDEKELRVDIKVVEDRFYNMSEYAHLRADKIESLNI